MEQKEISIQEALPILKEMLNISGLTKLIGKSPSWFLSKEKEKSAPFALSSPGFADKDIELVNKSLSLVADACESHMVTPPTEGISRREYHASVVEQLKGIRKLISFVYLREKYTTISEQSLSRKLRSAPNNGSICMFTESDIIQINAALKNISEYLRSLKIITK